MDFADVIGLFASSRTLSQTDKVRPFHATDLSDFTTAHIRYVIQVSTIEAAQVSSPLPLSKDRLSAEW